MPAPQTGCHQGLDACEKLAAGIRNTFNKRNYQGPQFLNLNRMVKVRMSPTELSTYLDIDVVSRTCNSSFEVLDPHRESTLKLR